MATILLFAKEPVPGRVTTRLVPPLSSAQAARLAGAFLVDLVRSLEEVPADLSTAEGRKRAMAAAREACGGMLDRMVLCAGLGSHVEDRGDRDYAYSGLVLNLLFILLYILSLGYYYFES